MSQPPDSSDPLVPAERPALDPGIVADDEGLGEAVDQFIFQDPEARTRLSEITAHQEWLKKGVDGETWKLVLHVDAMIVERWVDVVVAVARWGFTEGRKFPLPTEEALS
jgi:hypothetical protein